MNLKVIFANRTQTINTIQGNNINTGNIEEAANKEDYQSNKILGILSTLNN